MSDEPHTPGDAPDETRTMHTVAGAPAAADLAGMPTEMDGYRLLGVLGQGGMGVVYLAEQKEPRRRVAIKVIRGSAHADALHVRLFRREAETLGRLRHPNIGAIYGAGRLPDGRPYFAMELVEGPTLDGYLATRPSPANRAELLHRLAIAARIAEAVHYAHQRGVIHRDLKPSNIVIPKPADGDTPHASGAGVPDLKVLDFGLARLTDDDSQASLVSDVGTIRGTLAYMSPEQVRGETQALDVRSDVYTLGVILYEMLAGTRPYDVSRTALPEAMRVIGEQEPRPLRDLPSGVARVDTDLQSIVLKALAKEPERRYSSAAALAEDLERYRNSQPVLARTPSTAYQIRKLVARHKPLVGALAVALAAIVVAAVVSTAMFLRARTEAAKARQVAAFLSDMLEGAGPSVAKGRDSALLREILDRTAARVRSELAGQPDVAAGIEQVLARTYLRIGDLTAADEHARSAYETSRRLHRGAHEDVATALSTLAEVRSLRGQMVSADSIGREALTMWRALHPEPHPGTAQALMTLGSIHLDEAQVEAAEPLMREGLAMSQKLFPNGDGSVAIGLTSLGNLMHFSGRLDAADSLQRLALAMHRRLVGDLTPEVEVDLVNLSRIELDRGNFAVAESLVRVGLETGGRIHTSDYPERTTELLGLVNVYLRTGATVRAESLAREAVAVARRVRGGGSVAVGDALTGLGVCLGNQGRSEEALATHRAALAAFRSAPDAGPARVAGSLDNLANALAALRRFDAADSAYREAIPLKVSAFGENNPSTLLTKNNYGRMKFSLGDLAGAEALFREVLDGRRKVLGEESDQVAVSLNDLGRAALACGRFAEAESLCGRALTILTARLGPDAMNTNFARSNLGRIYREQGRYAKAATELRKARNYLDPVFGVGNPQTAWLLCEVAGAVGASGRSRESDSLFRRVARLPPGQMPPADVARFHLEYGVYLAKIGDDAEAEKHLLLAESALRTPREFEVRRRVRALEALVEVERARASRDASPARAAALRHWIAVRDAEVPELNAAMSEGRAPRLARTD